MPLVPSRGAERITLRRGAVVLDPRVITRLLSCMLTTRVVLPGRPMVVRRAIGVVIDFSAVRNFCGRRRSFDSILRRSFRFTD